jgi:energy-coupling factor transporter ATP-binding protein EcfA2
LHSTETDLSKLLILYGDNGSGKTTILKCLFHLLSPAKNKQHRSELARVPFRLFSVQLGDDILVTAERLDGELIGSFEMSIKKQSQKIASGRFSTDANLKLVSEKKPGSRRQLLATLESLNLKLHLLSDDRKIVTDLIPSGDEEDEEDDEIPLRRMFYGGGSAVHAVWDTRMSVKTAQTTTSLEKATQRLVDWIRKQAITGSGAGEVNVNTLYADITKRIVSPFQPPQGKPELEHLIAELKIQANRSISFARFGLSTELPADELTVALQNPRAADQALLLDQILRPFVDGVRLRLDALESIHNTISTFIDTINTFYQGKVASFHLREGITIELPNGENLSPNLLSSGEKQLLLLLCNVLAAGDEPNVFIIDEPELSLNVKWQRKLVDALLECTRKSRTQFVLATHSLELLTQHQHNVLRLNS